MGVFGFVKELNCAANTQEFLELPLISRLDLADLRSDAEGFRLQKA